MSPTPILDILAIFVIYGLSPFLLWVGLRLLSRKRAEKREEHEKEVKRAATRDHKLYIERVK